jgi:hypothetical protein
MMVMQADQFDEDKSRIRTPEHPATRQVHRPSPGT